MDLPWSNGMVGCIDVWLAPGGRLIGIDPHYRSDTARSRVRLPAGAGTRAAVSCNGSLAAIGTGTDLQIRDVQSGRLRRRIRVGAPIVGLSWGPDNRTLAYVTDGPAGELGVVDARSRRRHLLARLSGDSVAGMTWDPYAHTLVFSRLHRTGMAGALEVVNADGSGLRSLDRLPGSLAAMPQWSSRGGVIGYTRETLVGGMRMRPDVGVEYLSIPHPYPTAVR
jgi:hypothetical protein